jgi:hypothetical protein
MFILLLVIEKFLMASYPNIVSEYLHLWYEQVSRDVAEDHDERILRLLEIVAIKRILMLLQALLVENQAHLSSQKNILHSPYILYPLVLPDRWIHECRMEISTSRINIVEVTDLEVWDIMASSVIIPTIS